MKNLPSVATLLLVVSACSYTPVSPLEGGPTVASLAPSSGPVGTTVVIRGTGFSATGNRINFNAVALEDPREMPNEPSVIPDLPSADGSAITFDVLSVWRPACSYAAQGPCPFAESRRRQAPTTCRSPTPLARRTRVTFSRDSIRNGPSAIAPGPSCGWSYGMAERGDHGHAGAGVAGVVLVSGVGLHHHDAPHHGGDVRSRLRDRRRHQHAHERRHGRRRMRAVTRRAAST